MPIKPICFVVMPFGVKSTGAAPPAPASVDFDALWNLAIDPAIEALGFRGVRADQDSGALIINEMLERLYYSDLVVADISIANANAYYEVGVRHAARNNGCVLIVAAWARPVFDLAQVRHLTYPNPDAVVTVASAAKIRAVLGPGLSAMQHAQTPMPQVIPGYPNGTTNSKRAQELADQLDEFEKLRAQMTAIANMAASSDAAKAARKAEFDCFIEKCPAENVHTGPLAVELVKFVRDVGGDWRRTVRFINGLPEQLRMTAYMAEQRALAECKHGDNLSAIASLEALISTSGDSSERQGLLGGRYKKLYNKSIADQQPAPIYLAKAIDHYERGMYLDLNDYYPSCNLPALYRERARQGDEQRALAAASVARVACERALNVQSGDEWLRPTLLGLAFAEHNIDRAVEIADEVEFQPAMLATWKIDSTLGDLRRHVQQCRDKGAQASLRAVADRLEALCRKLA